MNKLALMLAAAACVLATPATAAFDDVTDESPAAIQLANDHALDARTDMVDTFGDTVLAPGKYRWTEQAGDTSLGDARVVISLSEQMAYVYRGATLVGAASVSSGKPGKDTPVGRFNVLAKNAKAFSRKYDNAPMPFMQRIDNYGIALHAGHNPGKPASHGCVRLPLEFAKKLFSTTQVGTEVLIAV